MPATPLIPDLTITRRIGTYGDILVIQVLDDFGNVVDLTNASSYQIKIQHETITTDNSIKTALIQGTAVNGTIYYVITTSDFQNPGKYFISSVINYNGVPTGKSIISYKTSPNWILNNA